MIEVFEPVIGEEEIEAVVAALRRGEISGSFGEAIPDFEQEFANYCGCEYGVAVSSGSTALHLAVAAAGIGPGDEVLVSSSTNIATALASAAPSSSNAATSASSCGEFPARSFRLNRSACPTPSSVSSPNRAGCFW